MIDRYAERRGCEDRLRLRQDCEVVEERKLLVNSAVGMTRHE